MVVKTKIPCLRYKPMKINCQHVMNEFIEVAA